MPRIVIVGGGPAGLAAAERLLHEGHDMELRLFTDRAYLGGKAASWQLDDGRVLENGQHVALGFYRQLPELLGRAGVDFHETTASNQGHFTIWEDRDQRAHDLHLGPSAPGCLLDGLRYTGWTLREKLGFAAFLARIVPQMLSGVPEHWDDLCLTALCLRNGLPRSIFATNAMRATRDAQLNWPGEISAYAMMKAIQRTARDYDTGEGRFPAGGMSRIWWEPIAARIEALGGRILRMRKLVGLQRQGRRLTGLRIARSRCPGHDDEPCASEAPQLLGGFDAAIVAIPPAALAQVLAPDPELAALPGLEGAARLTPVAPLGLHVWHRNPVRVRHRTVVCGLAPPLEFVVDNKPWYREYLGNTAFGAALHFVGQETGFEGMDDQTLLLRALRSVRRVPGYEGMDLAGVHSWQVVRNAAPHQRYWNAEPGSLRHKPAPDSPLRGLWLAGDWIRNEFDFPSMETAVHSGRLAAGLLLEALDKGALPPRNGLSQRSTPTLGSPP